MSLTRSEEPVNWILFFILLVAAVAVSLMVMPFTLALVLPPANAPPPQITPLVLAATAFQSILEFSVAIFAGMYLSRRVGFGLPILEGALKGKDVGGYLKSILGLSIGMGVVGAALVIFLSLITLPVSLSLLRAEIAVPAWKAVLATFDGGIAEEILFRLFLMTLFVRISMAIRKREEGGPTNIGIWASIILSALLFGIGHLPVTGALTNLTRVVIGRSILLNGTIGIIFGWLYQKKGLESAMIAHFSADITLHVILPRVASLFL